VRLTLERGRAAGHQAGHPLRWGQPLLPLRQSAVPAGHPSRGRRRALNWGFAVREAPFNTDLVLGGGMPFRDQVWRAGLGYRHPVDPENPSNGTADGPAVSRGRSGRSRPFRC